MIKILTSLIIIESLVITSFFVTPHALYQVITNINWISILISICVLASTIAVLTGIVYLLLNKWLWGENMFNILLSTSAVLLILKVVFGNDISWV